LQRLRDWLSQTPLRTYVIAALVAGLAIGFFLNSADRIRELPWFLLALFAAAVIALLARGGNAETASDAPYRSLVQGATYGIFRSNEKGLLFANPALVQMLGYQSESEMLALDMARDIYFDPQERQRLINLFRGQERGDGIETTWKRKDGAPLVVRLSFRVIRGLEGARAFEGIAEDLSVRRTLEGQLLHSEKLAAIGRMVAGAAHEINNPLTAILGYSELLAEDPAATPEQREFAEKIKQQARRTKVITTNLQSFSSQEPERKRQSVDVNSVVSNALRIEELNARDEYQLLEICMHILNNSVDALRDVGGGSITVRTWQEDGAIAIEFADSGPGIADLARVFDPFYTTKPIGEGAGLGLSACYGIVKEHGGKIEASNRPEGGAVVTIRLPISTPSVVAASSVQTNRNI
jgi:two-component system NtrC family sensor kinase